jgi:hypothetical protein
MMQSTLKCDCSPDVVARFNAAVAEIRERVNVRSRTCMSIAARARRFGLDATPEIVNRHYAWFLRWYEGGIATGYLINRTGIKRIPRTRK